MIDGDGINALHERIAAELGMKSYFCEPYHSWEKGSIENRNGILRRYFPKKFDWVLTNKKEIDTVVSKINATPMKCLGFKMPDDMCPLFSQWEAFQTLTSITGLFEPVKVDAGGYGISWNDDIDLSCDELYENGRAYEDRHEKR